MAPAGQQKLLVSLHKLTASVPNQQQVSRNIYLRRPQLKAAQILGNCVHSTTEEQTPNMTPSVNLDSSTSFYDRLKLKHFTPNVLDALKHPLLQQAFGCIEKTETMQTYA